MIDVIRTIEEFENNFTWVDEHYGELKSQYPNQYVAVLDGKVVDSDIDVQKLTKRLKEEYGKREKTIAVRYVAEKEFEMIL